MIVRKGHFVLSSGRHTNSYIQKFDLLTRPALLQDYCSDIAKVFTGCAVTHVVGPTTGGILVAYEVARQLGAGALYVEDHPDDETGLRKILGRGQVTPEYATLLIVDDVLTTGRSLRSTYEALRPLPPSTEVVGAAVLFDRRHEEEIFQHMPPIADKFFACESYELDSWFPEDCPYCAARNNR